MQQGQPDNGRIEDIDDIDHDDIYIMMKCLCVCHEKWSLPTSKLWPSDDDNDDDDDDDGDDDKDDDDDVWGTQTQRCPCLKCPMQSSRTAL